MFLCTTTGRAPESRFADSTLAWRDSRRSCGASWPRKSMLSCRMLAGSFRSPGRRTRQTKASKVFPDRVRCCDLMRTALVCRIASSIGLSGCAWKIVSDWPSNSLHLYPYNCSEKEFAKVILPSMSLITRLAGSCENMRLRSNGRLAGRESPERHSFAGVSSTQRNRDHLFMQPHDAGTARPDTVQLFVNSRPARRREG